MEPVQLTLLYRYATKIPCPLCKGLMRVMKTIRTEPDGLRGMFLMRCKVHNCFQMEVALVKNGTPPAQGFNKVSI